MDTFPYKPVGGWGRGTKTMNGGGRQLRKGLSRGPGHDVVVDALLEEIGDFLLPRREHPTLGLPMQRLGANGRIAS